MTIDSISDISLLPVIGVLPSDEYQISTKMTDFVVRTIEINCVGGVESLHKSTGICLIGH